MSKNIVSRRLEVNGIVQGVGFRPFVFQLATAHDLKGNVANTSAGVTIHIEGQAPDIAAFIKDLSDNPPPLAYITSVEEHPVPINGHRQFKIIASQKQTVMQTLISPDVSICKDCRRELFDPDDRRFRYPFINCTNCGPRYTIIEDIPYDRPKTSMRHFKMCSRCQTEYDDPVNRRFHAQPNACAECGPHVALFDRRQRRVAVEDPIAEAARRIQQGCVLAIKGLGGYHLAVDAQNDAAVKTLRARKHREEKPFALMSLDLDHIRQYAFIDGQEEKLLTSIQRPIVLLKKSPSHHISPEVSPRNRYFGVMLPYTPLHYLLLSQGFNALVMTSGNLSEEPIAIDNDEAFERLAHIADYFLIHNRDIYLRSDDSIVRWNTGETRFIRRSRGYIPVPVFLKRSQPVVLACGAELKNTICLTKGQMAFLSQHIGDLENLATYEFLEMTIRHMRRILAVDPEIVAHDLHPDYLSTRWALEQSGVETVAVQHHHAHIVSAMTENQIEGPVIGLSFDGTGYGSDGAIWGGEILLADTAAFTRAAHLAYIPMPGGTAAIKQPWRMAIAYLRDAFGPGYADLELPFLRTIEKTKQRTIDQMLSKGINSPMTSSLGRLFDGVAAICGLRQEVAFEGQAAMELEMLANGESETPYPYAWNTNSTVQIDPRPIVKGVVGDLIHGRSPESISSRFHHTLMHLFVELCEQMRKVHDLNRVVLSGGVFQNALLLSNLMPALMKNGFEVFSHRLVPTNDGGISLGQAVAAAAMTKR